MEDKIINKVDEILKIKNKNSNADVSKIEREIDKMAPLAWVVWFDGWGDKGY